MKRLLIMVVLFIGCDTQEKSFLELRSERLTSCIRKHRELENRVKELEDKIKELE